MNSSPKYEVGDILLYKCEVDNSQNTFPVDNIEIDEYGQVIYHHKYTDTCGAILYENDVIGIVNAESEEYKEYQLYLKLKEKYG